ncbi:MAG: hypothetical protein K1X88_13685 [Nannocystaceae bacterium]|nr:hypothetical protein [Nannocystaceae bacterium]
MLPLVAALAPGGVAQASNGNKPRQPVRWAEAECAQIVDLSQTATLHLDYTIGEEDVGMTADEVDDSRTMQFFAFRRQDFRIAPPPWITQADVTRAAEADPVNVVPGAITTDDVLESTSRFASSDWLRITADDARVPITFDQAAMGVDWDLGGATPGTYVLWGYTWEPVLNIWSARAGFVKLVASAAAAADAGPSIALLDDEAVVVAGDAHPVLGCADVADGSTVTLQWGAKVGSVEPQWQTVVEDEPIASGMLALDFVPPDEAANQVVQLRATVRDPQGREYTAYGARVLSVMADPDGGDDGGGDGGGNGCSCGTPTQRGRWLAAALPLWLLARRRRRSEAGAR